MKRIIKSFFSDKLYIELSIATVLFVVAVVMDKLMDFIIYMLYFIIFLEIIRALVNYITEERVTTILLVDAFIILTLREFIVNVVKINKEDLPTLEAVFSSSINVNLLVLSGVIVFLLFIRYLSVISSQRYLFKDKIEELKKD